jgi:amino acid transporter
VFGILVAFWKWQHGDRTVSYQKMDLISGKEEIDEEEERYLAAQRLRGPEPKWRKIWNSL